MGLGKGENQQPIAIVLLRSMHGPQTVAAQNAASVLEELFSDGLETSITEFTDQRNRLSVQGLFSHVRMLFAEYPDLTKMRAYGEPLMHQLADEANLYATHELADTLCMITRVILTAEAVPKGYGREGVEAYIGEHFGATIGKYTLEACRSYLMRNREQTAIRFLSHFVEDDCVPDYLAIARSGRLEDPLLMTDPYDERIADDIESWPSVHTLENEETERAHDALSVAIKESIRDILPAEEVGRRLKRLLPASMEREQVVADIYQLFTLYNRPDLAAAFLNTSFSGRAN